VFKLRTKFKRNGTIRGELLTI